MNMTFCNCTFVLSHLLSRFWLTVLSQLTDLLNNLTTLSLFQSYHCDRSHYLTHSHTMTPFDAPEKQAF